MILVEKDQGHPAIVLHAPVATQIPKGIAQKVPLRLYHAAREGRLAHDEHRAEQHSDNDADIPESPVLRLEGPNPLPQLLHLNLLNHHFLLHSPCRPLVPRRLRAPPHHSTSGTGDLPSLRVAPYLSLSLECMP